jgi:hypothetical protein
VGQKGNFELRFYHVSKKGARPQPRPKKKVRLLASLLLQVFHVARITTATARLFVATCVVLHAVFFHVARITTATARLFVATCVVLHAVMLRHVARVAATTTGRAAT